MDFVLTLHSHLPYVLNHGRWPHGSDWLYRSGDRHLSAAHRAPARARGAKGRRAGHDRLHAGARESARDPTFHKELERYFDARIERAARRPPTWATPGGALSRSCDTGASGSATLRTLFAAIDGDIPGAFRDSSCVAGSRSPAAPRRTDSSRCSAATRASSCSWRRPRRARAHLRPLARGCWLPECAYRPRGGGSRCPARPTRGSGPARANSWPPPDTAGSSPTRTWRAGRPANAHALPRLCGAGARGAILGSVRIATSPGVESPRRLSGRPGYLEFHKMRYPGGLRLWRDRARRRPRRQAAVRARTRPGRRGSTRGITRASPGHRWRASSTQEASSSPLRHRAVRALVVRGPGVPLRRLPRARCGR